MVEFYSNILSNETINYILNHEEVKKAKIQIETGLNNVIYFSIPLTDEIRQEINKTLRLDLSHIHTIPMRWIKGDTSPHIDKSINEFLNTYLIYLSDNQGELVIENESYPIRQNVGYIFSEGISHETINTGVEPRLLLGPMSEEGLSVGGATTITADGQTEIVYFRSSGLSVEYKINNGPYNGFSLPVTIVNSNTPYPLKVLFENDITIQSPIFYFICGSAGIQFGSSSLNNDGTRPIITIDGVSNYPGFIQNGTSLSPGNHNIYIYNLVVNSINSSTLVNDGGWIGQAYFANASSNNFIINCSSNGPIIDAGGGIVGGYSAFNGGNLTIIGCSSSGNSATYSGGIVGFYAGRNGGTVQCEECWSTGLIGSGSNFAGGIVGFAAGQNGGNITILNCYSSGFISVSGGGIFGDTASSNGGTTFAINCYSVGTTATIGNGIYGSSPQVGASTTNCYIGNGSWDTATANTQLTGFPVSPSLIGTTWVYSGINQPYILRNMGYNPYTITNIVSGLTPTLNKTFSQTINAGSSTSTAIVSNKSYTILQITPSEPTITINSVTGVISTTSGTPGNTYNIIVQNDGSYNISTFTLTINNPIPCLLKGTQVLTPTGYTQVEKLKRGDAVLISDGREVNIVQIYNTRVKGNKDTYPCFIPKGSLGENYPPNELRISQNHLIKYKNIWILPRLCFLTDKNFEEIDYYHIRLKNYLTDNLIIEGGVEVESLAITPSENLVYQYRIVNNESLITEQIKNEVENGIINEIKNEKENKILIF